MIEMANPWYAVTLIGAPELWAMFAALLFVIYLGMRVINRRKRDRKTKARLKDFLMLLVPTLVLTFLIVMVLKGYFAVPRQCVPCIAELVGCNPYCPIDSSFPSGHAATVFAGFTAIWAFAGAKRKWLPLFVIPLIVAASRIMLGVHTWLDAFMGAIIGIVMVFVVLELDKRI
jgi:membrane-associated phospholipid phosphatase